VKETLDKEDRIKGGSPVAIMSDLTKEEFLAVYYFRCWFEGLEAIRDLRHEFVSYLGYELGNRTVFSLEALCLTLVKKGRRKLAKHELNCKCVGADENCIAQLITRSTLDDKRDAELIAMLLSDPSTVPELVKHSESFGHGLKALLNSISEKIVNEMVIDKSNYH
jgi:hypothetical protein